MGLVFFHLSYFTSRDTLKIHPCCRERQRFTISVAEQSSSVRTTPWSRHLSEDRGCLHVLAAGNAAAVGIGVQIP